MSEDKNESKSGEGDPATEAIPSQKPSPVKHPKPPSVPGAARANPTAAPPSKPAAPATPRKAPRPPAEPTGVPAEAGPAAKPDAAKPDVAKPDAAKPDVAKPDVAKPDVAKPDLAETEAGKKSDPAEKPTDAEKPTEAISTTPAAEVAESPTAVAVENQADGDEPPPGEAESTEAGSAEANPPTPDAPTTAIPKVAPTPDRPEADPTPAESDAGAGSDAETVAIEAVPAAIRPPAKKPHAEPRRIPARGEDASVDARTALPQPRKTAPQASPQRVGPPPEQRRRGGRRWFGALAAALVLIVAAGVAGYLYLSRDTEDTSPEAEIRTTITSFTQALSSGDLATLRTSSCGDLAAYYRDIPDAEFADVHRVAVEQGNIPVVDGVDAVQITDDTAIAQVIAYTAANPNERSPRTFDLRLDGDVWKVCSPA